MPPEPPVAGGRMSSTPTSPTRPSTIASAPTSVPHHKGGNANSSPHQVAKVSG
jgi:hypothetical protein